MAAAAVAGLALEPCGGRGGAWHLGSCGGCGRGELCLRWSNINLKDGTLSLWRTTGCR